MVTALAAQSGVQILRWTRSILLCSSGGGGRGGGHRVVGDNGVGGRSVDGGGGIGRGHPGSRRWLTLREHGDKITVDSATLMNKGLEVIEAHHLFGLPYERIEVVVHPQSIVHAMVRMVDGALLAHLGLPDMRVPIAYALQYPLRAPVGVPGVDLAAGLALEFGAPTMRPSPPSDSPEAGARGDVATCALNAANEVAVGSFLDDGPALPGYSSCGGAGREQERLGRLRNVRGGRGRR